MEQHAAGKKVVVLIDEAQGLSLENLELVRMLSNLETTHSKLLQIILVGQPELADTLDSYEMRQLAQRISLNYHLSPLSSKETEAYIQHRLGIASQGKAALFSANACRAAYHYSGGIPRLINIVCDRALLLAYSHDRNKVGKKIVQSAIRELLTRGPVQTARQPRPYLLGGAAILFIAALAIAFFVWQDRRTDRSGSLPEPPARAAIPSQAVQTDQEPDARQFKIIDPGTEAPDGTAIVKQPSAVDGVGVEGVTPVIKQEFPAIPVVPESDNPEPVAPAGSTNTGSVVPGSDSGPLALKRTIEGLGTLSSRKSAVSSLLSQWGHVNPDLGRMVDQLNDSAFIDLAARQHGLRTHSSQINWQLIEKLNLPVILTLIHPTTGDRVYLTLVSKTGDLLRLSAGNSVPMIETNLASLLPHLADSMHVFWKNTLGFDMLIGYGAARKAVLGVQHLLRQIGYDQVPLSSVFDPITREAVEDFQKNHLLVPDGLVGPVTKIMLLRTAENHAMPHLIAGARGDS
jgi:general secretion pathway protein A